jgi:hypothetical protein
MASEPRAVRQHPGTVPEFLEAFRTGALPALRAMEDGHR